MKSTEGKINGEKIENDENEKRNKLIGLNIMLINR